MELFDMYHAVSGDLFYGRNRELTSLSVKLLAGINGKNGKHISLTGMARIGKTSLVKETCRDIQEKGMANLVIVEANIEKASGFWQFWLGQIIKKLVCSIATDDIDPSFEDELEECRQYFEDKDVQERLYSGMDGREDIVAKQNLSIFFDLLQCVGKKALLIIDEFDKAELVFGTSRENYGWFRSFLEDFPELSVVTISRRSIYYIENNCFGGSTLHGVFEKIPLFGFNNEEIDLFYERLASAGVHLSEEEKRDVWYYCGRSPYFLAIIGQHLTENPERMPIDRIAVAFNDQFDTIIELLKQEGLLSAMLQMFIGPTYNLTQTNVDKLCNMGYCIKSDWLTYGQDDRLYADYFNRSRTDKYMTVCDYFCNYLEDRHQAELDELWPKFAAVQKLLRRAIEKEYRDRFGDDWKKELDRFRRKESESYIQKSESDHERAYLRADEKKRDEVGNSLLNVIGVYDLGKIIRYGWNLPLDLQRYFAMSYEAFADSILTLHKRRNRIFHINGELLSPTEIAEVDDICDEMISSISNVIGK